MNKMENMLDVTRILDECNPREKQVIKRIFNSITYKNGETIFKQGEPGRTLYIVNQGIVSSITKSHDGEHIELANYSPGRAFGEMAIVEACPRSTTCLAMTDVELFTLDIEDFYNFIWSQTEIGIKLLRGIMRYMILGLQEAESFLTTMAMWGEKARLRAITDDLTGLYNKRYFEETAELNILKARQQNSNFSILIFDLDNFHAINEQLGIENGDELIKQIGNIAKKSFPNGPIVSRLGGDEFTVLMPDLPIEKSLKLAIEFKKNIETNPFTLQDYQEAKPLKITVSIGLAEYPMHGQDLIQLKQTMDKALYLAKEAGRNTIICA